MRQFLPAILQSDVELSARVAGILRRIEGGLDVGKIELLRGESTPADVMSVCEQLSTAPSYVKDTVTHAILRHVDDLSDE